jgi:hypothetical protein
LTLAGRWWFLFLHKFLAVALDELRCGFVQLDLIAYPLDFCVLVSDVRGESLYSLLLFYDSGRQLCNG